MKSLEIVKYKMGLFEKKKTGFVVMSWFELYQIKRDLEVLEILRKYRIDLIGLDNEDFNKVKQWLEKCEKYTKIG